MNALTLEAVQAKFGGIILEEHERDRVLAHIVLAGCGSLAVQIILDPAAPDGVRVYCTRHQPAMEDFVREALGLPRILRAANDNKPKAEPEDDSIDAETLIGMEFPPLSYVIPGYVVEGLTVLGGKPKLGKSWWAYDTGIAVGTGGRAMGKIECEQGDVLYLALEDNRRRIQSRIRMVCPMSKQLGINLSRLTVRTRAPRIDTGLLVQLEKWRTSVAKPRLIIIDVWLKVRPPRKSGVDPYAADYADAAPLQRYASEHRLAIVIVTHTRKMAAEDPIESISGTNGITGAADAVLVLSRDSKGYTLYGRGRDIEEIETAMRFDAGRWTILGDATEVRRSAERKKILEAIETAGKPIGPKVIAELSGLKYENVRAMLFQMEKAGEVKRAARGLYSAATNATNDNNATNDQKEEAA
jgi:RecA-family ATPase